MVDVRSHIGMHVEVNLEGLTIDGVLGSAGWLPGVVIAVSALGSQPSIQLDTPIQGVDLVSVEVDRVRPIDPAQVLPNGVPQEIIDLAHAGKTKEAIKRYRLLNGATLQEAVTAVNNL